MASEPVTLYDLYTKQGNICFSPNTWKTRLVLNYKNIPYKTHWLNHLNLASTLKPLVPPNGPPAAGPPLADYTVPAITTPKDGTSTMESLACAKKLEALYPTPSLHLETGLHEKAGALVGGIMRPLLPKLFPKIGRDIIPEEALEVWTAKRLAQLGKPLDEVDASVTRDQAWEAAKPGFVELGKFLREHQKDKGPFVLGSQVSYADFTVVNLLAAEKVIDHDYFEKMLAADERIKELWEACAKWVEKND